MGKKTKPKPISVQDVVSLYSTVDTINIFPQDIRFSCIRREEDVIMEPYLEKERERERVACSLFLHPHSQYSRAYGLGSIHFFQS